MIGFMIIGGIVSNQLKSKFKKYSKTPLSSSLSGKEIAEKIVELDTDDATDVISELTEERQERVFSQIKDAELTDDIKELLKYDEDTAGGLMAKELSLIHI